MKDDKSIPPLSTEEIQELREYLKGQRAVSWLMQRVKNVAVWFVAVVAGWALFNKTITEWLTSTIGK